jgi:hypothetical protein
MGVALPPRLIIMVIGHGASTQVLYLNSKYSSHPKYTGSELLKKMFWVYRGKELNLKPLKNIRNLIPAPGNTLHTSLLSVNC